MYYLVQYTEYNILSSYGHIYSTKRVRDTMYRVQSIGKHVSSV